MIALWLCDNSIVESMHVMLCLSCFTSQGFVFVCNSQYHNHDSSPVCVVIVSKCSVLQSTHDMPVVFGLPSSLVNDNKSVST